MILQDHKNLLNRIDLIPIIVEKLGTLPIDYSEKMTLVRKNQKSKISGAAAGVLLLLHMKNSPAISNEQNEEFTLLLIKRSSKVSQPGDLSCPGGMLNRMIDPLLRPIITGRIFPVLKGRSRDFAQRRDLDTFRLLTLFLTNAIRETWEEMNLCPCKIQCLGPLPTYTLHLFKRTIFPLVGFVDEEWTFRPNTEVERLVEIPLNTFFQEDNYGCYEIELSDSLSRDSKTFQKFPCLIYRDNHGREDILWGATFYIIMNFLKIVFDFKIPELHAKRVVKKPLYPDYMTGRHT
ncbi:MAG: CoA pyrophosphatase [Deltaproteobacteria bacterium]|nr:CoA pyrophosphatase [Deltaproteobacteria bacterium]